MNYTFLHCILVSAPQFYKAVGLKAAFCNMNSSVWVVWAAQGSKEKKSGFEFF